jgi:uncharacterized BrkB/YihY/UPF0761 family membrane protein
MPVDSRRLQGPETSFCYTLLEKKNANEVESALSADLQKILIGTNKVRKDKRMPTDARQLCNILIVEIFPFLMFIFILLSSFEDRNYQSG